MTLHFCLCLQRNDDTSTTPWSRMYMIHHYQSDTTHITTAICITSSPSLLQDRLLLHITSAVS